MGIIDIDNLVPKKEWLDLTDEEKSKLRPLLEEDTDDFTMEAYRWVMLEELFEVNDQC